MKEKTTYGLSPERLAPLLAIGLEVSDTRDGLRPCQTPAEVLQEILDRELPLDPAIPDSLPAVLNRPCGEVLSVAGRTMRDLVLDSKTGLAVVRTLKDYGKELARRRGPEAKKAAVTAIYYAAVAGALVFHHVKIGRLSYAKLQEALTDLDEKHWIPSDLKHLLRKAQGACKKRKA